MNSKIISLPDCLENIYNTVLKHCELKGYQVVDDDILHILTMRPSENVEGMYVFTVPLQIANGAIVKSEAWLEPDKLEDQDRQEETAQYIIQKIEAEMANFEAHRRVKQTRVSLRFLEDLLTAKIAHDNQYDRASTTPEDLRIVGVEQTGAQRYTGEFTVFCQSMSFDIVPEGEPVPDFNIEFTLAVYTCDVCGCAIYQQPKTVCAECKPDE